MLNLGQKLNLESFQVFLLATFLIDCSNLSQSMFRKTNHFQKCEQQQKNFQTII